jgi:hypothetical protein
MIFLSPVPSWVLAIAAVAIVWVAWRTYASAPIVSSRRAALVTLRVLSLTAIALFLLRPSVVRPLPRSGNVVPVVIDASRSMAIADLASESGSDRPATRFEQAVAIATGPLKHALAGYRLELLELRNDIGPLDPARTASGNSSHLAAAITAVRDRYRGRAVPGIILLSDGVDTGDGVSLDDSGPAVFAIGIGDTSSPRDQEIVSLDLDPEALPGSSVELTASVVSHGYGREPIDVRLLASGRPIDMRRVTPSAEGLPVRVAFDLPAAGQNAVVYTVDLPAREDEAALENNTRRALVHPIGRKRRLLFLQGSPGYEHGFLARAWASDPFLDLDTVVRKGQNDQGSSTFYVQAAGDRAAALASGLPADRGALFSYDGIVLGNATRDLLSDDDMDLLDAFVSQRGGGVLLLGGRSFAPGGLATGPLGALLPVSPRQGALDAARASFGSGDANRLALTADGQRHAMLRLTASREESLRQWSAAPALAEVAPMGSLRPGAQVLATASAGGARRPIVAVQRYGDGRTMVFAGEASWRWKMQRPRNDQLYDTFWRQAARWLSAPSPDPVALDVAADAMPGSPSTIGVSVRNPQFEAIRDASVEVVVTDERGGQEVLKAALTDAARGRYTAAWQPPARGLYRVSASARRASERMSSATRDVFAGGADLETADPRRRDDVLARFAEATGGRQFSERELPRIGPALQARLEATPAVVVRELWHGPWTFLALMMLLSAEWGLRRHWGLR